MRKKSAPVKRLKPTEPRLGYAARLREFLEFFLAVADPRETQELRDITGVHVDHVDTSLQNILQLGYGWKACWPEDVQSHIFPLIVDWFARTMGSACTVRVSTIPNAGYGLFALRDIQEGEMITKYGGIYMSDNYYRFTQTQPSAYVLGLENEIIDSAICFRINEMGRWANDFRDPQLNNCRTIALGDGDWWLQATRPIAQGQELGLDYGKEYGWCIQCGMKAKYQELGNDSNVFCGNECYYSLIFGALNL